jgi:hypothetical protein
MERVAIVLGYLPNVDEHPTAARGLGLDARMAFVLESYTPTDPDWYLDVEVYLVLWDFQARSVLSV